MCEGEQGNTLWDFVMDLRHMYLNACEHMTEDELVKFMAECQWLFNDAVNVLAKRQSQTAKEVNA